MCVEHGTICLRFALMLLMVRSLEAFALAHQLPNQFPMSRFPLPRLGKARVARLGARTENVMNYAVGVEITRPRSAACTVYDIFRLTCYLFARSIFSCLSPLASCTGWLVPSYILHFLYIIAASLHFPCANGTTCDIQVSASQHVLNQSTHRWMFLGGNGNGSKTGA